MLKATFYRFNPYLFTFQILTKDSVTIFVNAIMYYRVKVGI